MWSVGNSLSEQLYAYSNQNKIRTLSTPLEPQILAALSSTIRDHGAFILGFEEGADLVSKSDQFNLGIGVIEAIAQAGDSILGELSTNTGLVADSARGGNSGCARCNT